MRSWSLADSIALVEGAPPAPVGETRRGAAWAGSSGNGVNRPGPSPTSPPSGGSGPGVGLGEVLQGPKGRLLAQRGAGAPGSSGGPPAVLVGNEPHGGADQVVPAQVWTTDWGQVATGRFGKAGEPVAFPRALRSPAGGAPSTIRRAPPRPCRAGSAHTRRPSRRPPHRLGPRCPACSTARPRLLRRRCGRRGWRPGGRRGAMGADRARGRSRGRNASKGLRCHCRTASHTASVIFGDRPRSEAAPIVDARWWRISRTVMPGRTS